ncbi:MAG TPA: MBL fold metallo-hydrolase [Thermoanaerobaculia bacterium]|nr:MBL fold metallo-hydrolase [Thermoanaerobaculia bacterium]
MKLTFFGSRGYVEESSPTHAGHSAFTVETAGFRLLCDFGENRRGLLGRIDPDAIVVSHAHPDHAWGLAEGASAPVYASRTTHDIIRDLPIRERVVVAPGRRRRVGPFSVTLFPVAHSVRCPGTAIRLEAEARTLLYSGDVVSFPEPDRAFARVGIYVGDGSTLTGSLVRRHSSGVLIGHTTVRAQLGWLGRYAVRRGIFAHFGKGPIEMGDEALRARVADLASEKAPGCQVEIATDGSSFDV